MLLQKKKKNQIKYHKSCQIHRFEYYYYHYYYYYKFFHCTTFIKFTKENFLYDNFTDRFFAPVSIPCPLMDNYERYSGRSNGAGNIETEVKPSVSCSKRN